MIKMFYKPDNCEVDVYKFFEDQTCLLFSPISASKQNGNGWVKSKLRNVIPLEFYHEYYSTGIFMSKTEKNTIKKRLKLSSAIWTCTDGTEYKDFDEAILHEKQIIDSEVSEVNDETLSN